MTTRTSVFGGVVPLLKYRYMISRNECLHKANEREKHEELQRLLVDVCVDFGAAPGDDM